MSSSSQEVEKTEHGEVQQAGALATGGMNAWQTQKHVIQRKFMEVKIFTSQHVSSFHLALGLIYPCVMSSLLW